MSRPSSRHENRILSLGRLSYFQLFRSISEVPAPEPFPVIQDVSHGLRSAATEPADRVIDNQENLLCPVSWQYTVFREPDHRTSAERIEEEQHQQHDRD